MLDFIKINNNVAGEDTEEEGNDTGLDLEDNDDDSEEEAQ